MTRRDLHEIRLRPAASLVRPRAAGGETAADCDVGGDAAGNDVQALHLLVGIRQGRDQALRVGMQRIGEQVV